MNDNFKVYKHTSPDGKVYIGLTGVDVEARWQAGLGYHRNIYFTRAIKKYGWDNFKHEIIRDDLTKEEACSLESQLIAKYQSTDKRFGFNLTSGGEHFAHNAESIQKIKQNRLGKGKQKKSDETKARMREAHAGGTAPKKVLCKETGEVYCSINDAARAIGINKKAISNCCRNVEHYNTAGGFHWQFA